MNLPIIPHDKANHFVYGFVTFVLCSLFLNDYFSLFIVAIIALGKEIYDEYDYGGFDWLDILATISAPLVIIIKSLII